MWCFVCCLLAVFVVCRLLVEKVGHFSTIATKRAKSGAKKERKKERKNRPTRQAHSLSSLLLLIVC